MINYDDPEHKRRRNLVNRGFTKGRVDAHEPKIREIVTHLIDRVAPRGECEFVFDVAAHLPMIVIGDMLGRGVPKTATQLLRWSDEHDRRGTSATATRRRAWSARRRPLASTRQYHHQVVDRPSAASNSTDDLVSVLVPRRRWTAASLERRGPPPRDAC